MNFLNKKFGKIRYLIVALAAIIIFATTYSLILPAITMETKVAQDEAGIQLAEKEDSLALSENPDGKTSDSTDNVNPQGNDEMEAAQGEAAAGDVTDPQNAEDPVVEAVPVQDADPVEDAAAAPEESGNAGEKEPGNDPIPSDALAGDQDVVDDPIAEQILAGEQDPGQEDSKQPNVSDQDDPQQSIEEDSLSEEAINEGSEEETSEEETTEESDAEDVSDPVISFTYEYEDLKVMVEAPEGTFPEGTTMKVENVTDDPEVSEAVEGAADGNNIEHKVIDGKISEMLALDISFYDADEVKIEPANEIKVKIKSNIIKDNSDPVLVHLPDQGDPEFIDSFIKDPEQDDTIIKTEDQDQKPEESPDPSDQTEQTDESIPFDQLEDDELLFESDSFSVYAVFYTVEFHYVVNGTTYDFIIPGGGYVSLANIIETLGIDTGDSTDDDLSESILYNGTSENPISESEDNNSVPVSEATKRFMANIANVEFSDPTLVWTGKADQNVTVEQLLILNNLHPIYSSDLSQEQIAEINAQIVEEGDWALISLKPFATQESLMITMTNGDTWSISVTDEFEIESTDDLNPNYSYLMTYEDANGIHVLKTDGSTETFSTTSGFDKLGSDYQWTFYYVFTEKDRESSLDYTYYFIRPVANKTHTIALNEAGQNLVQYGTNNVAIIPLENGGFEFLGYNHSVDKHIELGFENGQFLSFDDRSHNPKAIHIYEQEPLPTYEFTVVSDDYKRGSVSATGTVLTKQAEIEQRQADGTYKVVTSNVNYYISETNTSKKNSSVITAVPATHTNSSNQNKWEFDYWDLNGVKLEGIGATIPANAIDIPMNGSVLTAHFKQKSKTDYIVPNYEKEGTAIDSTAADWFEQLSQRNVPLNQEYCKKTAEVYDYENRIYRVDLTAQSNLTTFEGTIDLGFIIDASASMKFPSKLNKVSGFDNIDIKNLNTGSRSGNNYYFDNKTFNINETYYFISDAQGTSTVFTVYWDWNNNAWYFHDASTTDTSKYYRINADNINYYTKAANDSTHDNNYHYQFYVDGDNGRNRLFYLNQSLNSTLSKLDTVLDTLELAKTNGSTNNNPDVKIAWNTFHNYLPHGDNEYQYDFASAKNGIQITFQDSQFKGGTSTDVAILDAAGRKRSDIGDNVTNSSSSQTTGYNAWWKTSNDYNNKYNKNSAYSDYSDSSNGFQWENSATKYAVLITDGAPQRGGLSIDNRFVEDAAEQLKAQGVKLVTVGLSVEDVINGKILLYDIADSLNGDKMFYSAKSGDELEDVLLQIVKTIMIDATVQGDITDPIGDAFYPVDKMTGRPLKNGQKIDLNGNLTTDTSNPYGTILYDETSDTYTVQWKDQNIIWPDELNPDGWHGTVYVKAKEALLGGNAVMTNAPNNSANPEQGAAIIKANKYSTSKDDQDNPVWIELKDEYKKEVKPQTPRVNVNELSFNSNDTEWTVYLGTEVDPKEQLKKLWDNIVVEEVVKKGQADDLDGNGLPDIGKDSANNTWYPIEENSILDNRENEEYGDKESFSMNALIRSLAEAPGKSYAWWDYSNHIPNWDTFLSQALTSEGIVIDYDVYSLNGNDNSTITINLTKDIVSNEEDDLINKSPHKTTVVNTTGLNEDNVTVEVPAEKYDLTILYSPDYSVVPVGQGGTGNLDFHTGIYGTIYQGHAAGTETSRNTHIINVYAEPLDVLKKDNHDAAVEGAVFKLYRKATAAEIAAGQNESLTSYDTSLTGQYYCISTATSGEDGIAHLAPNDITTPTHSIPVAGRQTGQNLLVPLEAGETYYLVEHSAPSGYKKDTTVKTVTVNVGPDLYTKLDKTTNVDDSELSGTPARPTIAYNWDEGVTFIVKNLGSESAENQAELVNHDSRQTVTLTDSAGAERTYMLRSDSDQMAVTQVVIINDVIVDIKIKKTDLDGQGLPGAIFQLKAVSDDGHTESDVEDIIGIGTVSKTIKGVTKNFTSAFETTGEEQTFNNLPDGTYRLYEVFIPTGYISTFRYIQFTIENRMIIDVTTDSGTSDKIVPTAATENSLALLTIKNTPGAALPNTGGSGTNMFYFLGIIFIGIAGISWIIMRRKRNTN